MRTIRHGLFLLGGFLACEGESTREPRTHEHAGQAGESATGGTATGGAGGDGPVAGNGGAGARGGSGGSGGTGGVPGEGGMESGGEGGMPSGGEGGSGECDCTRLIGAAGVRPDAELDCVRGRCVIGPDDCDEGLADCDDDPENGCEVTTDVEPNCGACGVTCALPKLCIDSMCAFEPCEDGFAHCGDDETCSSLDSSEACGACGQSACTLAHTIPTCTAGTSCTSPLCRPGYANCSGDPACETEITAASGSCHPAPLGTVTLDAEGPEVHVAVGDDGTTIVAGRFTNSADFDPTSGVDVHAPTDPAGSAFVSKYSGSGVYQWTRVFAGGDSGIYAVELTPAGSIVVLGGHTGLIDFDPGSGVSRHDSGESMASFVLELGSNGSLGWVRPFPSTNNDPYATGGDLALDASGAIYATGSYAGTVDFDPDAAGGEFTSGTVPDSPEWWFIKAYLVKLTQDGSFVWARSSTGECESRNPGVSVVEDRLWHTGSYSGRCRFDESTSGSTPFAMGSFAIQHRLDGSFDWLKTINNDNALGRVAGTPNAVFVTNYMGSSADLDPGPGEDRRYMPYGGSFLVKLDAQGAYVWGQTLEVYAPPSSLEATRSGGVVVPTFGAWHATGPITYPNIGVVMLVNGDASPGFSLELGPNVWPHAVALGGGLLVAAGHVEVDPQTLTGAGPLFITRYAFDDD